MRAKLDSSGRPTVFFSRPQHVDTVQIPDGITSDHRLTGDNPQDPASWILDPLPTPLPAAVSKQSLRLALVDFGIYHTAILEAINAITDEETRERMLAYYETATSIRTDHPALNQFTELMQITQEQAEKILRKAAEYDK